MKYHNHTGMSQNTEGIIEILQKQLATSFDLYSQVKQGHWNLKGPGFIGIHKMFDDMAAELENFVDTIAERIAALGGYPMGYVSAAAVGSILDNPADDLVADMDWMAFILDQYSDYSALLYQDIKMVGENDPASEDMLIEIVRAVDKGIYFLAAHLQDEEVESVVDDSEKEEFVDDGSDSTL